jgi:O-antigen ligase
LTIESEGISIFEILIALYLFIPLSFWFFKKLFIIHERIFLNFSDYLIISFIIYCFLSIFFTISNQFSVLKWLRELIVFAGYLFYFPIRDCIKKDVKSKFHILTALGTVTAVIAMYNLYKYKSKIAIATQFFQVYSSRVGHTEQLFMFFILLLFAIIFTIRSRYIKYYFALLLGLFTVSLILTFTRSYLLMTIVGIIIIPFFTRKGERKKMFFWIFAFIVSSFLIMILLFSDLTKLIFEGIIYRFVGTNKTDLSLAQRGIETVAILKQISANPIIGWGLGATFRRYDLFFELHLLTDYAHNAYLYLLFKLGIIGLLTYLIIYFQKLYYCWKEFKQTEKTITKNLLFIVLITLIGFFLISITSPQFYYRPSILVIVICWGIIEGIGKKEDKNSIKLITNYLESNNSKNIKR